MNRFHNRRASAAVGRQSVGEKDYRNRPLLAEAMKAMIVLTVCMASLMQIVHSASSNPFNITIGYNINVDFGTWSNFGANGGCVTCPYTCARPKISPDGSNLNYTNSTQINDLPAAYTSVQQNGCCFAAKSKSKRAPSCQESADPPKAEDCGFLSGPSLSWDIKDRKAPLEPMVRPFW